MSIQIENRGPIVIVRPTGNVSKPVTEELAELLENAMDEGVNLMIFDFSEMSQISSDGLRVVLNAVRRLHSQQGQAAFAAVDVQVRALFEAGGFFQLLEAFDDVEQAIASFDGDRRPAPIKN